MEKNVPTPKDRQRRFYLFLPLLVLPFLTLAFWGLGGGKGKGEQHTDSKFQSGLSTRLPEAAHPEKTPDKLSLYEQARRDSALKESDATRSLLSSLGFGAASSPLDTFHTNSSSLGATGIGDARQLEEEALLRQLEKLEGEISKPRESLGKAPSPTQRQGDIAVTEKRVEMPPREARHARREEETGDPEIQELNGMLEKILDIQHPDRVRHRLQEISPLAKSGESKVIAVGDSSGTGRSRSIMAVIHADQETGTGGLVRLRLGEAVWVNSVLLPKNSILYGTSTLAGERLKILVSSIRHGNHLLPVTLSAFDLDGQEGLYVPGVLGREALRDGSDQALQNLPLITVDPSLTAQIAGAGIQTAKGLFRRRTRMVKVKLPAGYQVLLRNPQRR